MPATPFGNATQTNLAVLLVPSVAGAFQLSFVNVGNPNATLVYVQFFDAASAAAVTVGTTVPKFWLAVQPTNVANSISFGQGAVFKLGVVVAITTTPLGSTAAASPSPITVFIS